MKSICLFAGLLTLSLVQCLSNYDVYYKWKTIDYDIPFYVELSPSSYVQQNNIISLIQIYENRMWIVTPRYLQGVPSTLNTVPYDHNYRWWKPFLFPHNESPKLKPFPSYEMNKIGDCNALQLAHGLDIDQFGRLWVVDVGRVNILEGEALNLCPAKLVLFDVTNGRSELIFTYTFPDDVAPPTSNIIKDIQVACETEDDCWAYIPDIAMSRLVIYDHKNQQSWTAQHPSMAPDPSKSIFLINGVPAVGAFGINGVGLAPRKYDFCDLYFSPLGSTTLYKIKTDVLKNPDLKQNETLERSDVINLGEKPGQSDGFAMTSKGRLYYGNLPDSSVIYTDTKPELMQIKGQKTVAQSNVDLLWPDGFSFDGKGKLVLTSSKFHLIQRTDPEDYNYRVILLRRTGDVYAYNSC